MEPISLPRIMYHLTKGVPTDHGWHYVRVETKADYDSRIKEGFVNSVADLHKESNQLGTSEPEPFDVDPPAEPEPEPVQDAASPVAAEPVPAVPPAEEPQPQDPGKVKPTKKVAKKASAKKGK